MKIVQFQSFEAGDYFIVHALTDTGELWELAIPRMSWEREDFADLGQFWKKIPGPAK